MFLLVKDYRRCKLLLKFSQYLRNAFTVHFEP
jgi:hypothetical protein